MKNHFAANLKTLRLAKGKTQLQIANDLGIKRPNIGSYEEGRCKPDYDTAISLARYFGVSLDLLIRYKINHVLPDKR